jgi:ATP dependent DNA ligase domain
MPLWACRAGYNVTGASAHPVRRPDPPRWRGGPGLATTHRVRARHDQLTNAKVPWLVRTCNNHCLTLFGPECRSVSFRRVHRAVPSYQNRQATIRQSVAARNQDDGFRVIARKNGARVRLYSRPGNDLTHRFPLIVETLVRLRSRSCIVDGEAVACDDNGVALFNLVRHRRHD